MKDFDVGARLKQVRVAAGFSQRGLAQRAGVPHGQISLVETNTSSPSVASLRKILGGVPMTLAEFFEPDRAPKDQVGLSQQGAVGSDIPAQLSKRRPSADRAASGWRCEGPQPADSA
jgi:transcriptional regulator with XRE-family HTH domain